MLTGVTRPAGYLDVSGAVFPVSVRSVLPFRLSLSTACVAISRDFEDVCSVGAAWAHLRDILQRSSHGGNLAPAEEL